MQHTIYFISYKLKTIYLRVVATVQNSALIVR